MKLYFENIRVVSPEQKIDGIYNLLVINGIIHYIGKDECDLDSDYQIIDGRELVCCPGFFDMHVHFRQPGFEYKEDVATGAAAAANGGFTGVLQMPNTEPSIDSVEEYEKLNKLCLHNTVDLHISASITKRREGKELTDFNSLNEAGVLLFTDDGNCVSSVEMMKKAFLEAIKNDLLISQHCEEKELTRYASINESDFSNMNNLIGWPTIAEDIIISRDAILAEYYGNRRYHVQHISSKKSVELVKYFKNNGIRITSEVTPHHFTLSDKDIDINNSNYKMNPPLRQNIDIEAIKIGLKDGTIDCIVTDHAPHSIKEKEKSIDKAPFGIIGLETSIGLVLNELYHKKILTLNEIIYKMSINPRTILGLKQIRISQGELANFTILELNKKWIYKTENSKSKSENSPFIDKELVGKPYGIINNGKFIKSEL